MSAESGVDESQFKGWRKYYNSTTVDGRAGVFKVTMGGILFIVIACKLWPKKKQAAIAAPAGKK